MDPAASFSVQLLYLTTGTRKQFIHLFFVVGTGPFIQVPSAAKK
jgi:hypothetical protein